MVAYDREEYLRNKDAHRKRQAVYNAENTVMVSLRFNRGSDYDVLAKLQSVESKKGYIRQLIRDDIQRTGFDPGPKPGDPPPASTDPVPTREQTPDELAELEAVKKAWRITD